MEGDATIIPLARPPSLVNLEGRTYGQWTVAAYYGRKRYKGRSEAHYWNVHCSCGKAKLVQHHSLLRGTSTKCKRCALGEEGGSKNPRYNAWQSMISRCENPKHADWKYYGARGIRVCDRWRNSFSTYLRDTGQRPGPEYTLDRVNNDGNYEPGNIRWATPEEQRANQRPRGAYNTSSG